MFNISVLYHWYLGRDWFSLVIKIIVILIPYFLVQFFHLVLCPGSLATTLIFWNAKLWSTPFLSSFSSSLVMWLANLVWIVFSNPNRKPCYSFKFGSYFLYSWQYFTLFLAKMKACCILVIEFNIAVLVVASYFVEPQNSFPISMNVL